MATDVLTVKVEFDEENAMNCIKNVLMDKYGMTLDELAELCKAKQAGRLVELPCKIGEIVYSAFPLCGVNVHQIRKIEINEDGCFACSNLMIPFSDFGKIAFLDRESAEARLKGVQNNG